VALSWNTVSGATSYNVKRSVVSGGPYTLLSSGLTVTNYTDSVVTNGTTYYYVVLAVNNGCASTNSIQVSATPNQLMCLPSMALPSPTASLDFGSTPIIQGRTTRYGFHQLDFLDSNIHNQFAVVAILWVDTNSPAYPVRFYRTVLGP